MTVAPFATEITYPLNGTAIGPFATVWPFETANNVNAYLNTSSGSRHLVLGVDFTVTAPTPLVNGGDVMLLAGPAGGAWHAGDSLGLVRITADGQPAALGEVTGFSPKAAEDALDHIERQFQELRGRLQRTLLRQPGATYFDAGGHAITGLPNSNDPTAPATVQQLLAAIFGGGVPAYSPAWADITGKPGLFPAQPMGAANITDFATAVGALLQAGTGVTITPSGGHFVIAATGGGGGAAGMVSIKDYGAVCNGDPTTGTGTDDTAAWNAAIAALNAGTIHALYLPGHSIVSGALTPFNRAETPLCIHGEGPRISGIIQTSAADVTTLSITSSGYAGKIDLRDFSILNAQKGGQALYIHVEPECMVEMRNVEISGAPDRRNGGFTRCIELMNVTSSHFENVTVHGWKTSNADPYPARWQNTAFGWYVHADAGKSSTNNRWVSCDALYCIIGWRCETHVEGFFWQDCSPAWCGTSYRVLPTDTTLPPAFTWNGGAPEAFNDCIVIDNAAYISISNLQIIMDGVVNYARSAVKITNCLGANIHHNTVIPAVGGLGSTSFLYVSNSNNVKSSQNQMQSLDGTGVRFTGTSSYCVTEGDAFYFPAAPAIIYRNDSSGQQTNKRRRMQIEGATDTQGKQSISAGVSPGTALSASQTAILQLAFAVEVGDRLKVSPRCFIQGTAEGYPEALVREYNHRPSSGTPYAILQASDSQNNWADLGSISFNKGQHYFQPSIEFDVVGAATDALISLEIWCPSGTPPNLTNAQLKVERM